MPLLGAEPVTGLDGEVDSLLGYRSPMHGPRPQQKVTATRTEEFKYLPNGSSRGLRPGSSRTPSASRPGPLIWSVRRARR